MLKARETTQASFDNRGMFHPTPAAMNCIKIPQFIHRSPLYS